MLLPLEVRESVIRVFGLVPARALDPHWHDRVGWFGATLPVVTHMFLHGNLAHLIGNMWTLWIFADNVEDRMGPGRFLAFYFLSGLAAAAAQVYLFQDSAIPMVGASGAVAGVLGAYLIMYPRAEVIAMFPIFFYPFFFSVPAITYLFVWFFTQLWSATIEGLMPVTREGGIAWWAHIGGFVFGLVAHPFFRAARRCRQRRFEWDEFGIEGAWRPWR
jgi:membrane associated rhomboid family serine protease